MNNSVFKSIVVVEKEVAIKWSNGEDSFIDLIRLRSSCPCAWCSGEKDVFGNIYSGEKKTLPSHAFSINKYEIVGLYGIRFFWKDGHSDGIYTFKTLQGLAENE